MRKQITFTATELINKSMELEFYTTYKNSIEDIFNKAYGCFWDEDPVCVALLEEIKKIMHLVEYTETLRDGSTRKFWMLQDK